MRSTSALRRTVAFRRRSQFAQQPPPEPPELPALQPVPEAPAYLVTHYAAISGMPAPAQRRVRSLVEAQSRLHECAAVACSSCFDCSHTMRRELGEEALWLFNTILEPVDGTAPWDNIELQLQRNNDCTMLFVSTCRVHTIELLLFHNLEDACIGVVYRGPTDFAERGENTAHLEVEAGATSI
jgi:hypothetical protein